MKIIKKIGKIINFLENGPITVKTFLISFSAVVAVRYIIENILFGFQNYSFAFIIGSMIQGTFLFFLMASITILTFLVFFTKERISKLANIILWGQWLIVLPPIIDKIIFKSESFWSFYIFDSVVGLFKRFFTFFGNNPSFGITYGTRIEILLAIIGIGFYVGFKKRSFSKGLLALFFTYIILYTFAVFPSLLTFIIKGFSGSDIFKLQGADVAAQFLTSLEIFDFAKKPAKIALHFRASLFYTVVLFGNLLFLQFILNKKRFLALLKNVRYPQMFFNYGLFFVGLAMGCFYFKRNISFDVFGVLVVVNLIISIFSAWFYSVFVNDLMDMEIDKITNKERPLIKKIFNKEEYREYEFVFMGMALLTAIVVGSKFFLIITVYLLITWVYSCYPFRLKRVIFVSSVVSAGASILFLFMGFIVLSDNQSLIGFPWRIGIFLLVVYIILIPIKDLKDIEGDKKNHISTIPILLGEDNARFVFGIALFISYIGSVLVLNEKKLWFSAIIFGSINYWLLNNKKIKIKHINWSILGAVFIYGVLLVAISFF